MTENQKEELQLKRKPKKNDSYSSGGKVHENLRNLLTQDQFNEDIIFSEESILLTPSDLQEDDGTDEDLQENRFELVHLETKVPDIADSDLKEDYQYTRNFLYTLSDMCTNAADSSLRNAKSSGSARDYEAFAAIMGNAIALSKELLSNGKKYNEIIKKEKALSEGSVPHMTNVQINNIVGQQYTEEEVQEHVDRIIKDGKIKPLEMGKN